MQASEVKWSYSGLKDFVNCPKQYQEVKVLKRFTKFPTKEMRYGTEVHSALEDYVKDGTPLLKNYERFQKQLDPLNMIRRIPQGLVGICPFRLYGWGCRAWSAHRDQNLNRPYGRLAVMGASRD